jgi:hypothetical protein
MNAMGNYEHECCLSVFCVHIHFFMVFEECKKNEQKLSFHHPCRRHFIFLLCCVLIAALCNDDANGNVPLGKSCNRYWSCQGGYPRLQRCPAQLVFDKHSLRCVVPPTEECEVPPTPAPVDDHSNGVANEQRGQVSSDLLHQRLNFKNFHYFAA